MKAIALSVALLGLVACARAPDAAQDPGPVAGPPVAAAPTPPAAPTPSATGLAVAPDAPARTDGFEALRFGMDAAAARAAWPGGLRGDEVLPDNCAYLRPQADAEFRVGFMFEKGAFVRYDVNIADVLAPGGGHVGQVRDDIERLYGSRIEVRNHEYVPGGHYLRVTDPAIADGALVFETDEAGKVTRWRVGRAPQVDYVEGCA